jgi:hypothetical protein
MFGQFTCLGIRKRLPAADIDHCRLGMIKHTNGIEAPYLAEAGTGTLL